MTKLNEVQKKIKEAKSNPTLEGVPDELKTEKKFREVEKKILTLMKSDHKHRKPSALMKCKRCNAKLEKKRRYIRELGFKDMQQYFLYKKVMSLIINKKIPMLYEKE